MKSNKECKLSEEMRMYLGELNFKIFRCIKHKFLFILIIYSLPSIVNANPSVGTQFKSIKTDKIIPLFPIIQTGGRTYISLKGQTDEGFELSEEVRSKVYIYKDKTDPDNPKLIKNFIDGDLVKVVLNDLKISHTDKIFYFLFNGEVKQIDVDKIIRLDLVDHAVLGLEIPAGKVPGLSPGVGFAFIGPSNPFKSTVAVVPKWEPSSIIVNPKYYLDVEKNQDVRQPLIFDSVKIAGSEFVHGRAKYVRKDIDRTQERVEDIHGYFLKTNDSLQDITGFFTNGREYRQLPETIYEGNWLNDYDGTLYIGPSGSGCGSLILFKKGSEPLLVNMRCGYWGC